MQTEVLLTPSCHLSSGTSGGSGLPSEDEARVHAHLPGRLSQSVLAVLGGGGVCGGGVIRQRAPTPGS